MKRQSQIRVCARRFLIVSAGGALRKTAGIMYLTNIDAEIGKMMALNLVAFDRQPTTIRARDAANKYLVCCLRWQNGKWKDNRQMANGN